MQVVVAGFEESRCRNLANAMDLRADALTWLDFETFTRCLDEEPWDDSATRVFWFFQAPSVALMETTRTAEMRAVRILEQWWRRNRAVLDLHRRHGMPLRLIEVGGMTRLKQENAPHDGSEPAVVVPSVDVLQAMPQLLDSVLRWAAPRYSQLYDALRASAWLPADRVVQVPSMGGVVEAEALDALLETSLAPLDMQSRLDALVDAAEKHAAELAQVKGEATETQTENELLFLQLHRVQDELREQMAGHDRLVERLAACEADLHGRTDDNTKLSDRLRDRQRTAEALEQRSAELQARVDRLKRQGRVYRKQLALRLDAIRRQHAGRGIQRMFQRAMRAMGRRSQSDEIRSQIDDIRHSRWFDAQWYLQNNDDVRQAGLDPVQHYYDMGWLEWRNPCAEFDTAFYLSEYDDVVESGMNPLWHFIHYGEAEGRRCRMR